MSKNDRYYGAVIVPNHDHTFKVTMCGRDPKGVYFPLRQITDTKAKQDAAYLQRKSSLHTKTSSQRNYEIDLYDFAAQCSVPATNIIEQYTVYIAGASQLLRTQVVDFLQEILFAVNNADIQGSLRVFYPNPQSPTSKLLFKDITNLNDLQNVCRLACAC